MSSGEDRLRDSPNPDAGHTILHNRATGKAHGAVATGTAVDPDHRASRSEERITDLHGREGVFGTTAARGGHSFGYRNDRRRARIDDRGEEIRVQNQCLVEFHQQTSWLSSRLVHGVTDHIIPSAKLAIILGIIRYDSVRKLPNAS